MFGGSSDKVFVGSGGATLDDVGVSGGGEIDVGSLAATGVALTLDDATSVTGGTLVFGGQLGQGRCRQRRRDAG